MSGLDGVSPTDKRTADATSHRPYWTFLTYALPFDPMRNVIWRASLTAILAVSWNVTTTHCALAAAATAMPRVEQPQTDECPMHAASKQAPSPAKKKNCGDVPCCKNLPAAKPSATMPWGKPSFGSANLIPICWNAEHPDHAPA